MHKLVTELRLDRDLYDVFAALDAAGLDPDGGAAARQDARDFRRAGVDHDDATRARITEINEQTDRPRPGVQPEHPRRRAHRPGPARAARRAAGGLADAHPADDDGLVTVTTDYPDAVPVADVLPRRATCAARCRLASTSGWPANDPLLKELFDLRREHATSSATTVASTTTPRSR